MKITISMPNIILNIIKVINEKLEIAPKKDKIIAISLWDFKDENEDTIPKMDLKSGLRKLAEDEKLFQLKDAQCLNKLGRFAGEKIELEINHERFKQFYKKYYLPSAKIEIEKREDKNVGSVEKFPHRMPAGTKWEYFTIQFLDEKNVTILFRNIKHKTNYRDMGFEDQRSGKPNSQWELLKIFAKHNGELDWETSEANEKVKKTKELLAKTLQNYFKIDYDPFHPYHSSDFGKAKKSYKIKILLIPPLKPEKQEKNLKENENLDKEISEIYKEQTPEVYDQ